MRRKLTESPRHVRQLEERIAATQAQLARVTENNERLVATLKEARAQIIMLKEVDGERSSPKTKHPTLSDPALFILAVTMFVGRLGPLSLVLALAARSKPVAYRPAVESVRIG